MRDTASLDSSKKLLILVDCNSFFVSCEQLFKPKLLGKPVVVLSNNDGCVVSRSPEAKALGIAMGEAAFKIDSLIKKHKVHVFSSNFSLYADMSARVMATLSQLALDIEVYSIDEAFLTISSQEDPLAFGHYIKSLVKQHTGIPVSLGIAPTKTLAKIANRVAKKYPRYNGVFDITQCSEIDKLLQEVPVGDVWGVGYQYKKLLHAYQIKTARDLKYASDTWVRKKMTIMGLKTVLELRGMTCNSLIDKVPAKQSITVSRSFGRLIGDKKYLQEAIACHTIRAAQKLRREKERAYTVSVYIATSRYHDHEQYFNMAQVTFSQATDYTPDLLQAASSCLAGIFRQGFLYKKVGVLLTHLISSEQLQLDLFSSHQDIEKKKKLMKTVDTITARFGSHGISYVAAGTDHMWKSKTLKKTPRYTTSWHELLTVS